MEVTFIGRMLLHCHGGRGLNEFPFRKVGSLGALPVQIQSEVEFFSFFLYENVKEMQDFFASPEFLEVFGVLESLVDEVGLSGIYVDFLMDIT